MAAHTTSKEERMDNYTTSSYTCPFICCSVLRLNGLCSRITLLHACAVYTTLTMPEATSSLCLSTRESNNSC